LTRDKLQPPIIIIIIYGVIGGGGEIVIDGSQINQPTTYIISKKYD